MLLGKRPRPSMRRTTSLSEFSVDMGAADGPQQGINQDGHQPRERQRSAPPPQWPMEGAAAVMDHSKTRNSGGRRPPQTHQQQQQQHYHRLGPSEVPTKNPRRNSWNFAVVDTAHFLKACGLCKRRLGPGKDTFMYRGEIAFCSLECRQQQIALDERKHKCSLESIKSEPSPTTTRSEPSGNGETAAGA